MLARFTIVLFLALWTVFPGRLVAADPEQRLGVACDLKAYPQSSPKEVLASVVKAVEAKKITYLLAHLAAPDYVDQRIKDNGVKQEELVKESQAKLIDNPSALKLLRRFLKDGDWETEEKEARVQLKDVEDRIVQFRKIGDRWFMENRYKPERSK
jgi:hypothetical protein